MNNDHTQFLPRREATRILDKLDCSERREGQSWLIIGAPGTGKTTLVHRVIETVHRTGRRVGIVDLRGDAAAADATALATWMFKTLGSQVHDPIDDGRSAEGVAAHGLARDSGLSPYQSELQRLLLPRIRRETDYMLIFENIDDTIGTCHDPDLYRFFRTLHNRRAVDERYRHIDLIFTARVPERFLNEKMDRRESIFSVCQKAYLSDFSRDELAILVARLKVQVESTCLENMYEDLGGIVWATSRVLRDLVAGSWDGDRSYQVLPWLRAHLSSIRALLDGAEGKSFKHALRELRRGKTLDGPAARLLLNAGLTHYSRVDGPQLRCGLYRTIVQAESRWFRR